VLCVFDLLSILGLAHARSTSASGAPLRTMRPFVQSLTSRYLKSFTSGRLGDYRAALDQRSRVRRVGVERAQQRVAAWLSHGVHEAAET
jgi:hypothetical protein